MDKRLRIMLYIFLLGLATYGWWKLTTHIRKKMDEIEAE